MRYRPMWLLVLLTMVGLDGGPTRAATLEPADPDEHTILLLRLDEGGGESAADSSGNHFGGHVHGARWNVGRFGYGLAFDGSGVYLDVPHDLKLCPSEAVTVETWLKLCEPSADVICKNTSYFMRIGGNLKAYFFVDGKWRILEGSGAIPRDRWTHVAMSYDRASRTMRTFVNGALDAEKKLDGLGTYALGQSSEPLRIGRDTWRVAGGVVGKVDEVRVSNVARTFEPFDRPAAASASVYVPNGSFEFGRYGWRSSYESSSRLEWHPDSSVASHGRWSLRSVVSKPVSIITKPIPFAAGADYVLSADVRSDRAGCKGSIGLESTYRARGAKGHRRNKAFSAGPDWQTVSLTVSKTDAWETGYAYAAIRKREGALWVDNVRLRQAVSPAATDVADDGFGIRLLTNRLGDTYFANTPRQTVETQVVNASATPRKLCVTSQVVDFFGARVAKVEYGTFSLAPYESRPVPFAVDTGRRGAFRVDFTVTDRATQQCRTMSYRYNVILPLKGVGDAIGSPFGMNTHMEREPNEHLSCNLEMLSQCGVKWIRAWWGWGMVEKQQGQFDWTEFDRQYAMVTEKEMRVMPILLRYYPQYEHAWAGLVDRIQRPPYKMDQWGSFVSQTVSRFSGRIGTWEIWNEPGCVPDFTPRLYADLCKTTYLEARRADQKCRLVGFAGVDLPYVEEAADAGALSSMDIIGEHSYHHVKRPETGMLDRCEKLRAILARHQKPMPVWHTEQGTGADGDGYVAGLLSEEECASSLVRSYVCALASGVEKFFWFSAQTSPTYGWAVFYEDYVPRPRLVALNALAAQLEGAVFRHRIPIGRDGVAHVFQKGGDVIVPAWDFNPAMLLDIPRGSPSYQIVDMMGNASSRARSDVALDIPLRCRLPVYLRFRRATVRDVGKALRGAMLVQTPIWDIHFLREQAGTIEIRLKSKTVGRRDAVVTVSCEPALKFTPTQQFVLDLPQGKTRALNFSYEPEAEEKQRLVTVVVRDGPFRLRRSVTNGPLRL